MQGDENYEHLEGGLDYNYWFYDENWGKVFLIINENDIYNQYNGEISEFSIIDYRWNEVFELPYSGTLPVDIDIDSIALSIEYDLLPFNMGLQGQEFSSNKICRKRCTIIGNIEIEFGQGINVDFYNGTLVVEEGATLTIGDSVTIHAKTGADSLIVYGDIEIGDHVNFIADEDASLFIYIENDSLTITIDSAYFENMFFEEKTYACTFNNSEFSNSMIKGSADYFLLSSSELTNTPVRLSREKSQDTCIARVEDCIILYDEAYRINDTLNPPSAQDHLAETLIGVEQYHHYLILNDSIVHDELDG
ncbi:MAG: hypothetical protein KAT48_10335, partial [Bacteroidales bacterium]|nr:hypothetical protein [Bacteroidales bacterium]